MGCRSWKEYQRLSGILSIPTQFKDGDSEICKGEMAYLPEVTQLTNGQTWVCRQYSLHSLASADSRFCSVSIISLLTGVRFPIPWSCCPSRRCAGGPSEFCGCQGARNPFLGWLLLPGPVTLPRVRPAESTPSCLHSQQRLRHLSLRTGDLHWGMPHGVRCTHQCLGSRAP